MAKNNKKETTEKTQSTNKKETLFLIIGICIIIVIAAIALIISGNKPKEVKRILTEQTEKDIKHNAKKLNVYLFYGDGCPHCEELINFLDNLPEKYDSYFDLYTFEVWYNQDNSKLMDSTLKKLDETPSGVPCLIVGDQVFFGYDTSMDTELKKAIKDEYLKADRFDIFEQE